MQRDCISATLSPQPEVAYVCTTLTAGLTAVLSNSWELSPEYYFPRNLFPLVSKYNLINLIARRSLRDN